MSTILFPLGHMKEHRGWFLAHDDQLEFSYLVISILCDVKIPLTYTCMYRYTYRERIKKKI